ncbi:MAG TPA: fluoride efflux transporter CrcB [Vicinamibacterales bacterium]|nr:fluoride efflux transporter CrcB [Vicinamibacterales bacterium]
MSYLMIALGGALGALARFALGGFVQARAQAIFPYGTLVVNLTGCLAMGFVMTLINDRVVVAPAFWYLVPVGFIGAFTTFSTFELETFRVAQDGAWLIAAANVGASVFFGFIAVWLGVITARRLF